MDIADFLPRGVGLGDLGDLGIAFAAVERVINAAFPQLYDLIEEKYLPVERPNPRGRVRHFENFGCGLFGCVLPTSAPGVVFKITADPSEIVYIEEVYTDKERFTAGPPEGVTKFLFYLPFPENITYQRQPVYAVWREEVQRPGGLADDWKELDGETQIAALRLIDIKSAWTYVWSYLTSVKPQHRMAFWNAVYAARPAAKQAVDRLDMSTPFYARNVLDPYLGRLTAGEDDVNLATRIEFGRRSVEIAVTEPKLGLAKYALYYLMNQEMYICDGHLNNLGLAPRAGHPQWVFSDVGQTLDLMNPGNWVRAHIREPKNAKRRK